MLVSFGLFEFKLCVVVTYMDPTMVMCRLLYVALAYYYYEREVIVTATRKMGVWQSF